MLVIMRSLCSAPRRCRCRPASVKREPAAPLPLSPLLRPDACRILGPSLSLAAWIACSTWLAAAVAVAAAGARRGIAEGRGGHAAARLKSPTIWLFTGYLVLAALVSPLSPGESASPLLGLGVAIPTAYALATLSAIGRAHRGALGALGLAVLHGGAVIAASAIVLALLSPAFLPAPLR